MQPLYVKVGVCSVEFVAMASSDATFNMVEAEVKAQIKKMEEHKKSMAAQLEGMEVRVEMAKTDAQAVPKSDLMQRLELHDDLCDLKADIEGVEFDDEDISNSFKQLLEALHEKCYLKTIQIFVRSVYTKTVVLHVRITTKVIEIKEMLMNFHGILPEDQRLNNVGIELEDDKTLSYYNIENESSVSMNLRLLGGGGPVKRPRERSVNPFADNVEIMTVAGVIKMFETSFQEAVTVSSAKAIDSMKALKKVNIAGLKEIVNYLQTDKTKHAEKVQHMATLMTEYKTMDEVSKKLSGACERFKKLFAEDMWKQAVVAGVFDMAELKCKVRETLKGPFGEI